MSTLKKFGDFFALFGAFAVGLSLLMDFMPFETLEETSFFGKIQAFFSSPETHTFYLLILFCMFFGAFLLSKLLPKWAPLHFVLSLLPVGWSFYLFDSDRLGEERPTLTLILALMYAVCAFADCLIADRADGKARSIMATRMATALASLFAIFVFLRSCRVDEIPAEEWNFFDRIIGESFADEVSFSAWWRIALMYALVTVIGLLLRDIFFAEALIGLIPFLFAMVQWNMGDLPAYGAALMALSACCLLCPILLTFLWKPSEHPRSPASLPKPLQKAVAACRAKRCQKKAK